MECLPSELESLTLLAATPGLGPIRSRALIGHFGSAQSTLEATKEEIAFFPGIPQETARHWGWWERTDSWEKNLELAEKEEVRLIPYTSAEYPRSLAALPDAPLILYVKGSLTIADRQSLAIVGTRAPSIYGLEMTTTISGELAANGFSIISGLARGIDTAAHLAALRNGRTLAVIGSGLSNIYPRENLRLADQIAASGAVLSEFPMLTPPDRKHFPQRNRIVSGMSLGALLIEAPEKSGAMITMDKAWEQGRKLFAIPGRADQENFRGNHHLIKEGRASLVENARDILKSFDHLFVINDIIPRQPVSAVSLNQEEKEFIALLDQTELDFEEIQRRTKLPVIKLNVLLMSLVMKKILKEYPGKIYKKVV